MHRLPLIFSVPCNCSERATKLADHHLPDLNPQYRKCRDHPLGRAPRFAEGGNAVTPAHFLERRRVADLEKRACWWGPPWFGCSDNYCWTSCGDYTKDGSWCWLAINYGKGEWARCSVSSQCEVGGLACGGRCSCY